MAGSDELSDEVKRAVVTALACYDTPSEVAAAVKEEFGLEVSRQRVQAYDPTKVAGKGLSAEFRAIFDEARSRYLADTADIGIAQKTYRLRMLERMTIKAVGMGNMKLASALLEQAAKEVGGAFTNRRELSGPDGKPIETANVPPTDPKQKVLDELRDIFGAGVGTTAAADAGAAPENPAGDDPVVPDGAGGGSAEEPGASAPGETLAVPE